DTLSSYRPLSLLLSFFLFFFFNDPPTPEIYPLSLHDALPISSRHSSYAASGFAPKRPEWVFSLKPPFLFGTRQAKNGTWEEGERSEEHTSELQSLTNLVCRLLLEKKKKQKHIIKLVI